jgi:ribosomal protein S24E
MLGRAFITLNGKKGKSGFYSFIEYDNGIYYTLTEEKLSMVSLEETYIMNKVKNIYWKQKTAEGILKLNLIFKEIDKDFWELEIGKENPEIISNIINSLVDRKSVVLVFEHEGKPPSEVALRAFIH